MMDNFNNSTFSAPIPNNMDNPASNDGQSLQGNMFNNLRADQQNLNNSDIPATVPQSQPTINTDPTSFQSVPQPASSFQTVDQNAVMPQQQNIVPEVQKANYSYDVPQTPSMPLNNETQSMTLQPEHGPSKFEQFKEGLPSPILIVALLFFMIIQNIGSRCKNFCRVDASMQNAIFSGGALGYILTCAMPYFISFTNQTTTQMTDFYLKSAPHSFLAAFVAFGIGFVVNHAFEKSASYTIMQDVKPSDLMYGLNTFILCCAAFIFAIFFTKFKNESSFSFVQYIVFFSGLFYIENAIIGNLYIDSHMRTRRILLSLFAVWGVLMAKYLSAIFLLLGLGFFLGFMFYSILKIETTSAKRNTNYIGFIISFFAIAAMNLIHSLHNSIHC